jgi:hypothetical protein
MSSSASTNNKSFGGRPKKFNEASRPVTVTLPERVLRQLSRINEDRALAITRVVDIVAGSAAHPLKPVEIVEVIKGKAIIIIGPSKCLRKISWLHLIEIAPTRFLLSIPTGTPVESLEVAIMDLLENLPPDENEERVLLEELRKCISHQRRRKSMSKGELLFIDLGR